MPTQPEIPNESNTPSATNTTTTSSSSSQNSTSFKLGATLWEVDVLLTMEDKAFANINIKGIDSNLYYITGLGCIQRRGQKALLSHCFI